MARLILGSASTGRKSILESLGLEFMVQPSDVDEAACPETNPLKRAQTLARLKAEAVNKQFIDDYVIGSDSVVVASDGTLLEKAVDDVDARRMINLLSGNTCIVHSAICLAAPGGELYEDYYSSDVSFKELSSAEIDWWIGTGLWKGRCGSFQIDGPGQMMISSIKGDYSAVVGISAYKLAVLLKHAGYDLCSW